jgi:asparagine synthase (glutamine-hydrolysing)
MRWFGGSVGGGERHVPAGAQLLHADPALWVAGPWQPDQARVVTDRRGTVAVIGPCEATDERLCGLLGSLPDSVVTDWAGAYTIIRIVRGGRVTILTDPANACPIYTVTIADALVWGSSSRALAALVGSRVDQEWLLRSLAGPAEPVPGRSAWSDVTMLPAGYRCNIAADARLRCTPAWGPTSLCVPEAIGRLRSTLSAAVRIRVRSAVAPASDLSGGLDSTTLTAFAAREGSVIGLTSHPAQITGGGDLDYARMAALSLANVQHVLLPLDGRHLPYGDIQSVPATDEPAPSTASWAMLSAEFDLLASYGVDCLLTGDGGDTLFLPPPLYLADLGRRGRYLKVLGESQRWARLRRISPWPTLLAAVTGRPDRLRDSSGPPDWLTSRPDRIPDGPPDHLGHADRALLAEARYVARTARAEAQLADTYAIGLHNPYMDARVLDTVLAVPGWLRASPTRYKPLLSETTVGLLPETVRTRGTKGIFVGDHFRGLRAYLDSLMGLLDGRLAELGLIEPARAKAVFRRAAAGVPTQWGGIVSLVAVEIWLRAVESQPPVAWCIAPREPVAS